MVARLQGQGARQLVVDAIELVRELQQLFRLQGILRRLVRIAHALQAAYARLAQLIDRKIAVQGGRERKRLLARVVHGQPQLQRLRLDGHAQAQGEGPGPGGGDCVRQVRVVQDELRPCGAIGVARRFQLPGRHARKAVAHARAARAELREDHGHAATDGAAAVEGGIAAAEQALLAIAGLPRDQVAAIQGDGGLRAIGGADGHGRQLAKSTLAHAGVHVRSNGFSPAADSWQSNS